MDYGKALRICRAIAGLEQKELAASAGIDPSHVSLIEKGARKPSVNAIAKLCRALQIPEPLFGMLAAEKSDLHGTDEKEFEKIGAHLTKFLLNPNAAPRRSRPKSRQQS